MRTHSGCYRWLTLPFGRRYSPVICQRLVSALVKRALRGLRAMGATYLDDVLISAVGSNRGRVTARRVGKVLRRAGFLRSSKSIVEPVRVIDFMGKKFDAANQIVENKAGLMGSAYWV